MAITAVYSGIDFKSGSWAERLSETRTALLCRDESLSETLAYLFQQGLPARFRVTL